LHIQDDVRVARDTGNIFLTNIHRVYLGDVREPSLDDDDLRDYFLSPFGPRPAGKTTDSKTDLGEIVREIDELAVFNDEAHHIHDSRLAWFKCIQDIHHQMLQKDMRLALQVDVTATPRHNNGAIFVQTVSDYPLVEAIYQGVVKQPVLPDAASRARLHEHNSAIFTERYVDYLQLGIEEWRKSYAEHEALGKKAVLFVMVDDTRNCDEVGAHLEKICPELQGAVLVIHTKNNGEISEAASGKKKDELELLRKQANEIDSWSSPHKAIVSVLMLKEGWDVRNVTTIVGLRAYAAKSDILPEQTLGRGLRRMYFGADMRETVAVMGTPAFMEFVESIQSEGVTFEREDPLVLRNLSEPEAGKILFDSFTKAINALTVRESGTSRIEDRIRLRDTRPFRTEHREYLMPKKSLFSKIVGEPHSGGFELTFAAFLDNAPDIAAFAKNYLAVGFKIDYVKANGELSNYVPDFIAKTSDGTVWIIETKGREELDLPKKMQRLRQWTSRSAARPSTRNRICWSRSPTATPGGAGRIRSSR